MKKRILFGVVLLMVVFTNGYGQQGLKAEFYDGANFNRFVAVQYVDNIDMYWNDTPPVSGIDPHVCSIRWTGKLKPTKSGSYKFSARVDDGIRVWIDDQLIIDQWELNDVGKFVSDFDFVANTEYDLKVEYFNALIEGEVRLLWKIPKTKDELSWSEYLFGESKKHTVIAPEYFLRPDEIEDNNEDDLVVEAFQLEDDLDEQVEISIPEQEKVEVNDPTPLITEAEQSAAEKIIIAKKAEKFTPKNIAFEKGKTVILKPSIDDLEVFAQFMLDYPHLTVMIEGHTDPVGDAEMNLQLSKDRAYTIANYLTKKGIDSKRIDAEGYGGSRPLVVPKKGTYYPANRRVVFVVGGLE